MIPTTPPAVILMAGLQGSGKTTWCQQHLPDFFRISQDDQGQREHFRLFEEAVLREEPLRASQRRFGQEDVQPKALERIRCLAGTCS